MYDPDKIVIFEGSGHAKVIIDIIESKNNIELIGFIDKLIPQETTVLNYKVIGDESLLPELMRKYNFNKRVIGIRDNFVKSKVVNFKKKLHLISSLLIVFIILQNLVIIVS